MLVKGIITTSFLTYIIKYLSTSLDVRSIISENQATYKYSYFTLACDGSGREHWKDFWNYTFDYVSYLISFGPNITGRYQIDVECSGALVTHKHIFTAAHCFYKPDGGKKELDSLYVVGGAALIGKYAWWRHHRKFSEAWIHSKYKPMTFINDLAIGELNALMQFYWNLDIIYTYVPYSYYQNVLSDYWRMCVAVGFWTPGGTWKVDAECVRQIHPYSCNYSSGIKGAMCVGYAREPFKEQGSPLACYDYRSGYTILTGIMLTSCYGSHTKKHWPALYLRLKDYWNDQTVPLSEAPE